MWSARSHCGSRRSYGATEAGTQRHVVDLSDSGEFSSAKHAWKVRAPDWEWARVAVWDVAANGAFVNPVRR